MDNLIYLYALVPTKEAEETALPSLPDFDGEGTISTLAINGSTAVICELDGDKYSEATIENKIDNDMEWLQKKAFHHHETISALNEYFTVIPLKFCTIYKTEESLKETIQNVDKKVMETFDYLKDKEEWTLKIYSDDKKLREAISQNSKNIEEKRKEIEDMPRGRRFFAEKKIDSLIDKELEDENNHIGETLHDKLKALAADNTIKKNWGKDVTGLKEDMVWNSVYLLPGDKVDDFIEIINEQEEALENKGWRLDVTGPWPSYHFSSFY